MVKEKKKIAPVIIAPERFPKPERELTNFEKKVKISKDIDAEDLQREYEHINERKKSKKSKPKKRKGCNCT